MRPLAKLCVVANCGAGACLGACGSLRGSQLILNGRRRRAAADPARELSFGALVERRLVEKVGDSANRVVGSWHLDRQGYEHVEVCVEWYVRHMMRFCRISESNPLMRQEAKSYESGPTDMTHWDVDNVSWTPLLRARWHEVRDEFRAVALSDGGTWLRMQGNNIWAAAVT